MEPEPAEGDVCIPNIGPAERAKRMRVGLVAGAATLAAVVALVALHAPRGARLGVFFPAILSAYGVLQAREKT